jgi:opacity protein-like surface antigen
MFFSKLSHDYGNYTDKNTLMKQNTFAKLAAVAAIITLGLSSAQASDHGVYTKLDAGASFITGLDIGGLSTKWKTGFATNGAVGFNLNQNIGLELEGGYSINSLKSVDGVGAGGTGIDLSSWSGFGNVVFKTNLGESVSLYLGGGPGFVHYTLDTGVLGSESDTLFAGQAKTGVSFKVVDHVSVDLSYRARFVGSTEGASSSVNHQITAGISIGF